VAGRPFFMVTASVSRDAVLALHLTQLVATGSDGVVVGGTPRMGWCLPL